MDVPANVYVTLFQSVYSGSPAAFCDFVETFFFISAEFSKNVLLRSQVCRSALNQRMGQTPKSKHLILGLISSRLKLGVPNNSEFSEGFLSITFQFCGNFAQLQNSLDRLQVVGFPRLTHR